MRQRWSRLIHGQTCPVCEQRRRVRWFFDSGVCSNRCMNLGMWRVRVEGWSPSGNTRLPKVFDQEAT